MAIEPPELETCVAILMSKAQAAGVALPEEVAFFIAQAHSFERARTRRRAAAGDRERAVHRSADHAGFAKEALQDLLACRRSWSPIENIQKTVAEYFKIRMADLLSKRRSRSIARPRQIAMALAKELTTHSLPEIGDAFGGRDHTTVLHACKRSEGAARDGARAYRGLLEPVENPDGLSVASGLWTKLGMELCTGHAQPSTA